MQHQTGPFVWFCYSKSFTHMLGERLSLEESVKEVMADMLRQENLTFMTLGGNFS
jgi:hypothetical protein